MAELVAAAVYSHPLSRTEPPRHQLLPLWLCLQFPDLALESRPEYDPQQPQVLVIPQRGVPVVLSASAAALKAGVCTGMRAQAATAISSGLLLLSPDTAAERRRLRLLAEHCSHYTPSVSLVQPDALLLELRASVRLFGGLRALLTELQQTMSVHGHLMRWATAVTPLAATLLARTATAGCISTEPETLRTHLGPLPAALLVEDPRTRQKLQQLGVRTLRDLWRLPRSGLAKRFGPTLLTRLDQLLGKTPDPRKLFINKKNFFTELELEFPSCNTAVVLAHAKQLLQQLLSYLRRHDLVVGRIQLLLQPQHGTSQMITIGSRRPGRELSHWQRLLNEALGQQRVSTPVWRLCLTSQDLHPFAGQTINWLQPQTIYQDWSKALDELETRLQRPAWFLSSCADHRPERAWCLREQPDKLSADIPARQRPLWLLPRPRLLSKPPRLLQGPERIEAGWWDGKDCCRDYYTAAGQHGERLWIFHDLKHSGWFLHGLFG